MLFGVLPETAEIDVRESAFQLATFLCHDQFVSEHSTSSENPSPTWVPFPEGPAQTAS